jgi:dTDP-4-amino-4,6-dideoxygalactose transaminase
MALNVSQGHQVITTPFTFFATAGCISRVGAKPVFVDIEPDTFLISLPAIADAVNSNTRAIVPVHLYGQMVDMNKLAAVSSGPKTRSAAAASATNSLVDPSGKADTIPPGIPIIEDAAQAIGARDPNNIQIGQMGRCACLSFYPTKNLGAAGDAGALVTRNQALTIRFFQTRQHGETARYHHSFVGGNFRMDAIQAAVLTVKLKHLTKWNQQRQAIAAYYTSRFAGTDILPPVTAPGATHVFHQYVIRVPKRDALRDHLTASGVGCNIFYPKPLHMQACFADLGYKVGQLPNAEKAANEVLALPIFPELNESQIQRVADTVLSFYR